MQETRLNSVAKLTDFHNEEFSFSQFKVPSTFHWKIKLREPVIDAKFKSNVEYTQHREGKSTNGVHYIFKC